MSPVATRTRADRPAARPPQRPARPSPWWHLLVLGVSFGLGYGIADRILRVQFGGWVPLSQPFGVRPTPGRSLEQWRQGSGEAASDIRGDLELLELQERGRREAEELRREQVEQQRQEATEAELRRRQQLIPAPPPESDRLPETPAGGDAMGLPEPPPQPLPPPPPAGRP